MKKNVAGQTTGAQMLAAADGSAFSGAVTVFVTGDGGTQAQGTVGSGACVHEGNGYHSYAPSQAETNFDHVAFTFVGTGAAPATVQGYTTFPQGGDAYGRLGAPAGASVSADVAAVKVDTAAVKAKTDNLPTDPADQSLIISATDAIISAMPTADENADALLKRDWTAVTGEAARSVLNALRFVRNKWTISGTTLSVKKEDDSTEAWNAVVSVTPGADPITGSDPG